jgi:hypothetical protein
MNAINTAYHLTVEQMSQPTAPTTVKPSFWQRALTVLSNAGLAALIVG